MNTHALAILFMIYAVVVSACASSPTVKTPASHNQHADYALISENLVKVLGSLESINPLSTTFQLLVPTTPIGQALFKAIEDEGYGIQIVTGDLGDNFLRYTAEVSQTESGFIERYSLSVGNHTVQRQYALIDGKTTPTSPVTVQTDSVIDFELDDSLFGVSIDKTISNVIKANRSVPEVVVYLSQQTNTVDEVFQSQEITPSREPNQSDETIQGNLINPLVTLKNVRHNELNHYKSIFEHYSDVSGQTLNFSNNSLVLSLEDKFVLSNLAAKINPETDLVSVVSCSRERSPFENSKQLLAKRRVQRVTQSLILAGLAGNLLFDEACWASQYSNEEAPHGSVLVTHKRLKNQG